MDTSEDKKLQYYVSIVVGAFILVHFTTICWRAARLFRWGFSDRILSFFSAESIIQWAIPAIVGVLLFTPLRRKKPEENKMERMADLKHAFWFMLWTLLLLCICLSIGLLLYVPIVVALVMGAISFGVLYLHLVTYRAASEKRETMQIWSVFFTVFSVVAFLVFLPLTVNVGDKTSGLFYVLSKWFADHQPVSMSIALSLLFILLISIVMASIHSFYMSQQRIKKGASVLLGVAAIEIVVFIFGLAWSTHFLSKEYMTYNGKNFFIVYSDRDAYYGCLIEEMDKDAVYIDLSHKIILDIDGVQRIKMDNSMVIRSAPKNEEASD